MLSESEIAGLKKVFDASSFSFDIASDVEADKRAIREAKEAKYAALA